MEKMIAYCGLPCHKCPVFLATAADDDLAREKAAAQWKEAFGWDLSAADINCDGCLADGGRLFMYCGQCGCRACAREKSLANCAHCNDFGCAKVQAVWDLDDAGRRVLENIRREL